MECAWSDLWSQRGTTVVLDHPQLLLKRGLVDGIQVEKVTALS
jgi:hypothetical protein